MHWAWTVLTQRQDIRQENDAVFFFTIRIEGTRIKTAQDKFPAVEIVVTRGELATMLDW